MAKKGSAQKSAMPPAIPAPGKPSALLDTRVVYCGDNLEQLARVLKKTGSFYYRCDWHVSRLRSFIETHR